LFVKDDSFNTYKDECDGLILINIAGAQVITSIILSLNYTQLTMDILIGRVLTVFA